MGVVQVGLATVHVAVVGLRVEAVVLVVAGVIVGCGSVKHSLLDFSAPVNMSDLSLVSRNQQVKYKD